MPKGVHVDELEVAPGESGRRAALLCTFADPNTEPASAPDPRAQAYSRLIVTCSTFALYTASFTKSANNAIAAADTPDGDHSMAKRWDILGKFETNFNHWCVPLPRGVRNSPAHAARPNLQVQG